MIGFHILHKYGLRSSFPYTKPFDIIRNHFQNNSDECPNELRAVNDDRDPNFKIDNFTQINPMDDNAETVEECRGNCNYHRSHEIHLYSQADSASQCYLNDKKIAEQESQSEKKSVRCIHYFQNCVPTYTGSFFELAH